MELVLATWIFCALCKRTGYNMNLEKIRLFITVAERLSFTKAAEDMYISQPTLSRHISELEALLGIELFERTTRKVSLTPAGEQFLRESQEIMRRYDSLMERVSHLGEGISGSLTVGYLELFAQQYLPGAIRAFRNKYPMVDFHLKDLPLESINRGLMEGKIDLGFVVNYEGNPKNPEFEYSPLMSGEVVVVVGKDHALSGQDEIEPVKLKGERIFTFDRQKTPGLWDSIIKMCMSSGFTPDLVEEDFSPGAISILVRSGLGISIFTSMMIRGLDTENDLHAIRLQGQPITAELELAWRKDSYNPCIRNFVNIVRRTQ